MAEKNLPAAHVLSREFIASLPTGPGVYIFRDRKGEVVYVGKAADLKNRLSSYRALAGNLPKKTVVMLGRAVSLETIVTPTEKEALLLEASLIKKHRPRYNVVLRDDKNYPYLRLTVHDEWPRLMVSRRRREDGARYFGPYASASALRQTISLLGRVFPLRKCRDAVFRNQDRPCLEYQIGRCLGPCCGLADAGEYREAVADLVKVLEGKSRAVEKRLEQQMSRAAEDLEFEKAAGFRDRLAALRKTLEKQAVVTSARTSLDAFALAEEEGNTVAALLKVRSGLISGRIDFYLPDAAGSRGEIISQVVREFYAEKSEVTGEIILSDKPADLAALEEWLGERRGGKVRIAVPARGDRRRLVEMAAVNAARVLADRRAAAGDWRRLAARIAEELSLATPPKRIECLDISNTGGREAVGSLVSFDCGSPDKDNYRHYNIRTLEGPDDYGMMREVVSRRLADPRPLPDLLLLDGGRGQLAVILDLLREKGSEASLPLAAIAKGRGRGADRIFVPGRDDPLELDPHSALLFFFMRVRDEAHRFGISRHRRRRDRASMASRLDQVRGLGPARRKKLLAVFGSAANLARATPEEIAAIPGISRDLAEKIIQAIKK